MFEFPKEILKPGDTICEGYFQDLSENYYHHYYDQVVRFKPRSVVEIGVRAGYSAYAMLSANKLMRYVGYDIDAPVPQDYGFHEGAFAYAQEMLAREFPQANLKFITQDTQKLTHIKGSFDLAHVDGDHSFEGCWHDLQLCSKVAKILLIDDFDFVPSVRNAVMQFVTQNKLKHEYISNFRGMAIIDMRK